MRKIFILSIALLNLMIVGAQTMADTDRQISDKLKQANTKYTTIVSDFKQTQRLAILNENVVSGGRFYYNKPYQLVMNYSEPTGNKMIIDGEQFVMAAGGKERKTTAKSNAKMRGMKVILSACLEGDVERMGASKISCYDSGEYYVVTADIDRKLNKSNIEKVNISYDKKDMSLSILQTIEADGSFTIYELTGKKFNTSIDPQLFGTQK